MHNNAGFSGEVFTHENEFIVAGYKGELNAKVNTVDVAAATVDSGATPTTLLRKGFVVRLDASLGDYLEGDHANADSTVGILMNNLDMLDVNGVAEKKWGVQVLTGGATVKESALYGLDGTLKTALQGQGVTFV